MFTGKRDCKCYKCIACTSDLFSHFMIDTALCRARSVLQDPDFGIVYGYLPVINASDATGTAVFLDDNCSHFILISCSITPFPTRLTE